LRPRWRYSPVLPCSSGIFWESSAHAI